MNSSRLASRLLSLSTVRMCILRPARLSWTKLKEKYEVPVLAIAVNHMSEEDVHDILREALYEFPVSEININMPQWIAVLSDDHWLKKSFHDTIQESMSSVDRLREVENITDVLNENEYIDGSNLATIDTGQGDCQCRHHCKAWAV